MKLSELVKDEKYGNLEVRIESLFNTDGSLSNVSRVSIEIPNELLLPKKPKTVYDLKVGDKYWFLNSRSEIGASEWDNHEVDKQRVECGSVFLTKEEAQFEIECRKVYQELKRFSKEFEKGKLNWFIYCYGENCIDYNYNVTAQYSHLHFESEEKAQEAVKAVGEDRVLKYYLKVK